MPTDSGAQVAFFDDADDAAADALAALRRAKLIRMWHPVEDGTYDVLVGRGTVGLTPLDAAGVLALAADLRRDQITLLGGGRDVGHRWTQYDLSDGRQLDRRDGRHGRYLDEYHYSIYVPGGDPSGCAGFQLAARTQIEALALAGLARVRGRCNRCELLRPLTLQGRWWRPDPTIRCPGCDSGATTITLLCGQCREPIVRNPDPGRVFPCAWMHVATGNPFCVKGKRSVGYWRDEHRAQLG